MAIKVSSGQGVRGLAEVSYNPKSKQLLVVMDDNRYNVLAEDAPAYLVKILAQYRSAPFRINMNSDGTQIFSAGPKGGQSYFAVLDRFVAKEGEVPTPRMVPGGVKQRKDGKGTWTAPDQLQFTAIFRVIQGRYAASVVEGCEIPFNVPYAFKPTDEGVQIAGSGSKRCAEFLVATGMDFINDTIPTSDNVLPWLEKVLQEREQVVIVSLNQDGYVDTLAPAPEGMTTPTQTSMDDGEEEG